MDVPSSGIVSRIEMQGLGTRIPGIQFFYPAMNLLFQIIQCVPVLEQAVLELQDMALELAAFPIDRRISLYIMYKVNAARKSKVDDNTAKMQSIKWLGV